jgi:hypothetical protein
VGDEDDGDAELLADAQDQVLELEAGLRVHRRERLVHEQQVGPVGERPGDRHPLLHAAGQLPGMTPAGVGEADRAEHLGDAGGTLGARHAAHSQRQVHVSRHGQPGEQGTAVVLEHHADARRHRAQRRSLEQRLAACRLRQARQGAQQRGLARAARPDHAGELAPRHLERDVRQGHLRAGRGVVHLAHVAQRHDRRARLARLGRRHLGRHLLTLHRRDLPSMARAP